MQGLGRLEECLVDFFSHETLDGDNQYACDKCRQKRYTPPQDREKIRIFGNG